MTACRCGWARPGRACCSRRATTRRGCGALAALLRRYPEAPLDAALLARAGETAETELNDTDLALELYRAAEWRAGDADSASARARARAPGRRPR